MQTNPDLNEIETEEEHSLSYHKNQLQTPGQLESNQYPSWNEVIDGDHS